MAIGTHTHKTNVESGAEAARFAADHIKHVVAKQGAARVIVATGASQFVFLKALVKVLLIDCIEAAIRFCSVDRVLICSRGFCYIPDPRDPMG